MDKAEKKSFASKITSSEGVILAAIPVAGYALGFSYESGFFSFYELPSTLVSVEISTLFPAILFSLVHIFILLVWLSAGVDCAVGESNSQRLIGNFMLYIGFFLALLLLVQGPSFLIAVMGGMVFLLFLARVLPRAEKRFSFIDKAVGSVYEFFKEEPTERENKSAFTKIQEIGGAVFFILVIPCFVAYSVGQNNARDEINYDVIDHPTFGHTAVIRIQTNHVVSIPFDIKTKQFDGRYLVSDLASISEQIITNMNLGPLLKKEADSVDD